MVAASEGHMQKSVRELDSAKAAAAVERRELAAMVGTLRGQLKQRKWLGWTGSAAFILGLLISPVVARVSPFEWDGHVAAFIMRADRWNAGGTLMEAQDPQAWRSLSDALKLTGENQAALTACREAAAKTKKQEHCLIVVPVW